MSEDVGIADHFERNRRHLERVALRMLGSKTEAEDAIQEAWMRVRRSGTGEVENLGGWITTVVARVCLDMLRSRAKRREVDVAQAQSGEFAATKGVTDPGAWEATQRDPEADLLLADSVGPALLVVLETLGPAERVAFVLHDMFDMTFEEIAPILGRSPGAVRQLGSRARRRVQEKAPVLDADVARHHEIVGAFLAASRDGNFEALLALLDPEVAFRADALAIQTARATLWGGRPDLPSEAHGARAVVEALRNRGKGVRQALVDGSPGAIVEQGGQTRAAWTFVIEGDRIVDIELVMDPECLAHIDVTRPSNDVGP